MTLPRFFCQNDLAAALEQSQPICLDKTLAHYMQRVLRLADLSQVVLFNGQGGEYVATLHYKGKNLSAKLLQFANIERELPWSISIAQGLATGDKMDWICEKSVEMGAAALIPIAAKHSTLKLSGERLEKRLAHWQRIAQAASEQCGRNRLLTVAPLQTISSLLQTINQNTTDDTLLLFCDPDATQDFPAAIRQAAEINNSHWVLLIGPEGGWSEQEKKMALDAGAISMRFGSRVLRTETAAIALLGAIRGQLAWIA